MFEKALITIVVLFALASVLSLLPVWIPVLTDAFSLLWEGENNIFWIVKYGSFDEVKTYLENQEDVNVCDEKGCPLLHLAVRLNRFDIVSILVEYSADINLTDPSGKTAIRKAASACRQNIVEYLAEHGATLDFYSAASLGNLQFFQNYVSQGGDVNVEIDKMPLLVRVCYVGCYPHIVRYLLDQGADLHATGVISNETALYAAASSGSVEAVSMLISEGADIYAQTKDRQTPLDPAVYRGSVEVTELLLAHQSEIKYYSANKLTALLSRAVMKGYIEVAKVLVEHGARINDIDISGKTPLHYAAERNDVEMVKFLLSVGADPRTKGNFFFIVGYTPIESTTDPEVVRILRNAMSRY